MDGHRTSDPRAVKVCPCAGANLEFFKGTVGESGSNAI